MKAYRYELELLNGMVAPESSVPLIQPERERVGAFALVVMVSPLLKRTFTAVVMTLATLDSLGGCRWCRQTDLFPNSVQPTFGAARPKTWKIV